jgi:hypothetical protein
MNTLAKQEERTPFNYLPNSKMKCLECPLCILIVCLKCIIMIMMAGSFHYVQKDPIMFICIYFNDYDGRFLHYLRLGLRLTVYQLKSDSSLQICVVRFLCLFWEGICSFFSVIYNYTYSFFSHSYNLFSERLLYLQNNMN